MMVSVIRTQLGCIVRQKGRVLRDDWWSMVGAWSGHKPGWSSLVMVAWACKGGEGRLHPLSDTGFESSGMIGVTVGAWLAFAPPISPGAVCLGLLLAGCHCQLRSHKRTASCQSLTCSS